MMIIDGYVVDCELVGEPQYELQTTDYPIEGGSSVIDHSIESPVGLNVEGVISDTPIGDAVLRHAIDGHVGGEAPSRGADQRLLEIFRAKEPVQVSCNYGTFDSMVMVSYSPKRVGGSLQFSASFKRADFVTNDRTIVRVAVPIARNKDKLKDSANPFAGSTMFRTISSSGLKEQVGWVKDPKHEGGGYFVRADGKTPLTQEEVDAWQNEEKAAYAKNNPTDPFLTPGTPEFSAGSQPEPGAVFNSSRGRWEDADGNPIAKNPVANGSSRWWADEEDKAPAYFNPGVGQPISPPAQDFGGFPGSGDNPAD